MGIGEVSGDDDNYDGFQWKKPWEECGWNRWICLRYTMMKYRYKCDTMFVERVIKRGNSKMNNFKPVAYMNYMYREHWRNKIVWTVRWTMCFFLMTSGFVKILTRIVQSYIFHYLFDGRMCFVFRCLTDGRGMAYGGQSFPATGFPVMDVGNIYFL